MVWSIHGYFTLEVSSDHLDIACCGRPKTCCDELVVKTSPLEVFTEAGNDLFNVADFQLSTGVPITSDEFLADLLYFVLLWTC